MEWQEDDSVWYDILAFSRPNHFLARLGYLILRTPQRQVARDSAAAMQRAVGSGDPSFFRPPVTPAWYLPEE